MRFFTEPRRIRFAREPINLGREDALASDFFEPNPKSADSREQIDKRK
jgi:hypothetical protein